MKEAVILAAGYGWRLKPNVWSPKPLIKVTSNKTLLDFQIEWLREHGFDHVVVTTLYDNITKHDVDYSIDSEPLGTSGSLCNALSLLRAEKVYVMNIDDIVIYDPNELLQACIGETVMLCSNPRIGFGVLKTDGEKVLDFNEKPMLRHVLINVGHYVFPINLLKSCIVNQGDLETHVFPKLAKEGRLLFKFIENDKWRTLNTVKDLIEIKNFLRANQHELAR